MSTTYLLNPHCQRPHLVVDKHRWLIRFYFTVDGEKKALKSSYNLNNSEYLIKTGSQYKETNKSGRKLMANQIIETLHQKLSVEYFDPYSKQFVISDMSMLPLKQFLSDYIDYTPNKQRTASSKAVYLSYNNVLNKYFDNLGLNNIALKEVSREMINNFLNTRIIGNVTTQRDNYLTYLKGFFKYCVEYLEILPKNPLRLLHRVNNQTSDSNKAYPPDLMELVLNRARLNDKYLYLLLKMIFYTLRRPDELLKLQFKDFNLKNRTIDFSSDKIKTKRRLYSKIPLHLSKLLEEYIPNDVKPDDYFLGSLPKANKLERRVKLGFAFDKTPLYHFQDKFKVIQKQLDLEDGYTIYSFKHTGVVYLIEKEKWSDEDIITYTGHTDIKILGRYSRDAKRERKEHTATI